MEIKEFFEKYQSLGFEVIAKICEAEAGNELVSHNTYSDLVEEMENYADMDRDNEWDDYEYDIHVKASKDGEVIELDTDNWRYMTAEEILDKLKNK